MMASTEVLISSSRVLKEFPGGQPPGSIIPKSSCECFDDLVSKTHTSALGFNQLELF